MKNINREEFIKVLESLDIPLNEGIQEDYFNNSNERIVFWDYVWEPIIGSGERYNMLVTYQVSYFSEISPRNSKKLIELINNLTQYNINPTISHEYNEKEKMWHSFFSVDILENV